jgi:hypothetical protein
MTGARQPHVLLVVENVALAGGPLGQAPCRGDRRGRAGAAAGAAELAGKGA